MERVRGRRARTRSACRASQDYRGLVHAQNEAREHPLRRCADHLHGGLFGCAGGQCRRATHSLAGRVPPLQRGHAGADASGRHPSIHLPRARKRPAPAATHGAVVDRCTVFRRTEASSGPPRRVARRFQAAGYGRRPPRTTTGELTAPVSAAMGCACDGNQEPPGRSPMEPERYSIPFQGERRYRLISMICMWSSQAPINNRDVERRHIHLQFTRGRIQLLSLRAPNHFDSPPIQTPTQRQDALWATRTMLSMGAQSTIQSARTPA